MPVYLTFAEAGERVRTAPETIRYWVHIGRLKAFKPGRRVLIRESDLEACIAAFPVGAAHAVKPRGRGK